MLHLLRCAREGEQVKRLVGELVSNDSGQDLLEYSLLAIFLALAISVGLQGLASAFNVGLGNLGGQVSGSG